MKRYIDLNKKDRKRLQHKLFGVYSELCFIDTPTCLRINATDVEGKYERYIPGPTMTDITDIIVRLFDLNYEVFCELKGCYMPAPGISDIPDYHTYSALTIKVF